MSDLKPVKADIHDFRRQELRARALTCMDSSPDGDWLMNLSETMNHYYKTIQQLTDRVNLLQARIDMLMQEFCPEEMTEEQWQEWEKSQVVAKQGGNDD